MAKHKTIIIGASVAILLVVAIIAGILVYHYSTPTQSASDSQYTCYDSDGGFKPEQKGYVKLIMDGYEDTPTYDYCDSTSVEVEYYCIGQEVGVETFDCQFGCSNGACKSCEPKDEKRCSGNDVYWYDSCGNKGDFVKSCPAGCSDGICEEACKPKSCSSMGFDCGSADDGCGNTLSCGSCSDGKTCQSGVCKAEACKPSCTGKSCGDDGCGGLCGTCDATTQICKEGVCAPKGTPTPATLDIGQIIAIVVAIVLVLGIVGVVIFLKIRKK